MRVPNTDRLKAIAKSDVVQANACGASIPVPKWMDTNDLAVKPARHTQYRFEIIVTEWGAYMGIQTGDIPSKISATFDNRSARVKSFGIMIRYSFTESR